MKIKTSIISLILANNLFASGIPTVDVASIAQQAMAYTQNLKDYALQIKQYEQMVKDTLNIEKQLKEYGVDMQNIGEILGEATALVDEMQGIYDYVSNIPEDFMQNLSKITMACNFLQSQVSDFNLNEVAHLKSKYNRCTALLRDNVAISKKIDELSDKMYKTTDYAQFKALQSQIQNIKNAQKALEQKENLEKTNQLLAFYDTYRAKDKTNPYSKTKMDADFQVLLKQLKQPNNQKQAQALTNTILLKMLDSMQKQYELNMEFSNVMTSLNINNTKAFKSNNVYDENSYKQEWQDDEFDEALYGEKVKALPKDKLGLPIFTIK